MADKRWFSRTWLVVSNDYPSLEDAVAHAHMQANEFATRNGLVPAEFKLTAAHGSKFGRRFYTLVIDYHAVHQLT